MLRCSFLSLAIAVALSSNLAAMKSLHEMIPENLGTKFKLAMSDSADDKILFVLTRNAPQSSMLRGASLSIVDKFGDELACVALASYVNSSGNLEYQFTISKSLAKYSCLTFSEEHKTPGAIQEVGGGDIYFFSLIDFIENTSGMERLLRRLGRTEIDVNSLEASERREKNDEPSEKPKSRWPDNLTQKFYTQVDLLTPTFVCPAAQEE